VSRPMALDTTCGMFALKGMYTRLSPYNWASRSEKPANNSYSSVAIEPRGPQEHLEERVVSRPMALDTTCGMFALKVGPLGSIANPILRMHGPNARPTESKE
jgi:hypothetical protein